MPSLGFKVVCGFGWTARVVSLIQSPGIVHSLCLIWSTALTESGLWAHLKLNQLAILFSVQCYHWLSIRRSMCLIPQFLSDRANCQCWWPETCTYEYSYDWFPRSWRVWGRRAKWNYQINWWIKQQLGVAQTLWNVLTVCVDRCNRLSCKTHSFVLCSKCKSIDCHW